MAFKTYLLNPAADMTEVAYLQLIIDTITGLDSRITCNTTAVAQYADTSATATFDFDINGKYIIRMKRAAVNSTSTRQFKISVIINEAEYNISSAINIWLTNTTATGAGVGGGYFRITAWLSEGAMLFWFGGHYNQEVPVFPTSNFGRYVTALIYDENNVAIAGGLYNYDDISAIGYYKCDDGTAGYSLAKPLNYTDGIDKISYIENNPISTSGLFSSFAKDLIASSTIALGTSIVIDGKTYFAVATNLLVLVEEAAA